MNQDFGPLITLLQNANSFPPLVQTLFLILGTVLPMTAFSALAGLPFMAVTAQVLGEIRQRSFYPKAARQLATLAVVQGVVCTIAGGLFLWLNLADTDSTEYPMLMQGYVLWWAILATCTLCVSLYVILWKSLREWQLVHQCLGILGGSLGAISLYAGLNLVATEHSIVMGGLMGATMWELFVPQEFSSLWGILCFIPPLALSLSAGLGALWLLARRKSEDYGRDHYNTMLPWCAAWARNAWGIVWLLLLAFTVMDYLDAARSPEIITVQELGFQALYQLLWTAPALLWFIVARSKFPLRHSLTLVLAQCMSMGFIVPLCVTMQ